MALRGEGVREKLLVSILKKPGRCLPGSKRGIDPRLSPSGVGGENLEFLRDAEPDDARIEREDVGRQAGIVRVQEGIGDRRLVDRKSTRLNPVTNAHLVCRLLLENKKTTKQTIYINNIKQKKSEDTHSYQ